MISHKPNGIPCIRGGDSAHRLLHMSDFLMWTHNLLFGTLNRVVRTETIILFGLVGYFNVSLHQSRQ